MELTAFVLTGAFVISGGVGLLTGIFGVGGGFLLTPSLIILLRVPPALAVGTDLTVILLTSSVGLFKRRGTGTVDIRLALVGSVGSMAGVLLGQRLLQYVKALPPLSIAGKNQNALEFTLLWAFLGLLGWIAALLYYDYRQSRGREGHEPRGAFGHIRLAPHMHFASVPGGPLSIPVLLVVAGVIGLLTGLMGIGGGVLWLPALFYLVGQRTLAAAGTSLLLVWLSSFLASVMNIVHGNVCWPLCVTMLAGGVVGSWYGTHVGLRLAGTRLRFYFIYVVLTAMVLVACKVFAMTWGRG